LTEALIQAEKRGVSVTLVIDRYTGQGSSEKALEKLKQAGLKVQLNTGAQLLHHKWAYIDEKILVQGSANWTLAAFSKNEDCFMILQDLSTKQRKFLNELWHIIYQDSK
jgi:phosphatidylserine/phosphatidylglycerophosphate/cardiolipin synthase-like enzyme